MVVTFFTITLACSIFASSALAAGTSDFAVCFSPGGGCDVKLTSFATSAKATLDIAIYSLTLPNLAQAIQAKAAAGVKVRIVVDKTEAKAATSLVGALFKAGVPVKFGNVTGLMHNKFMIVDSRMLETGSFNYSTAATSSNAENQIYLDNVDVVKAYQEDFEKLWANGLPPH